MPWQPCAPEKSHGQTGIGHHGNRVMGSTSLLGRHEVEVHQDRVRRRELVGGGGIRHGGGIFHGGGDCAGDDCDGGRVG